MPKINRTSVEKVSIGPDITLYLSDCIQVLKTMRYGSIDFIFTDPPYGHNNHDGDLIANRERAVVEYSKDNCAPKPINNDGEEADWLFKSFLHESRRILINEGVLCSCCSGGGGRNPTFARWSTLMDKFLSFKQMIIWDKGRLGLGWQYHRSYETILVAYKGSRNRWYDHSHTVDNVIRPGDYGISKIIPKEDQHPTIKPIELSQHFMSLHTRVGDTVLDPFMGSGTTAIACIRTGRRFIGIENDRIHFEKAHKWIILEHQNTLFSPSQMKVDSDLLCGKQGDRLKCLYKSCQDRYSRIIKMNRDRLNLSSDDLLPEDMIDKARNTLKDRFQYERQELLK